MTSVKATNISVYTCDASAFVRYVAAPSIDEEHAQKQQRYLNYLRQLGPIPCGGSRIDRSLVREAIPLGIQIKVRFCPSLHFVFAAVANLLFPLGNSRPLVRPSAARP